jgi:very-short-patch-repair endonuclease
MNALILNQLIKSSFSIPNDPMLCKILGLNEIRDVNFIAEYKFHPTRRWRFDFADEKLKIAIEVEGGAFTNGRHTRGKGFVNDMEKYNNAVLLGWKLLRFTPSQMNEAKTIKTITDLILKPYLESI